ncbi:MAG TPA: glycosyltransferase family 2 protein [Candidatus Krumholzibacteria bacterium]|nr:glycosyltransferase family 2 protein [Candidatus Krumholzibacteria bacterium]
MVRLSVVMVARNEARNLARSLGSVAWADERVVVDAGSTDGTAAAARALGARVVERPWDGYSRQVEHGVGQATGDWILVLDADEEVTPELAAAIRGAIADPAGPGAWQVRRRMRAFGRWIDHGGWSPDWQLRLFRRGAARAAHREIHGAYVADGPVGRLDGLLLHHTYDHVHACVARMNDYTSLEVANRLERRPDAAPSPARLLLGPLGAFLRCYVRKAGWRDGPAGLWLALLTAQYTMLRHLKLWEYRLREREDIDDLRRPPIRAAEVLAARERP